jgi:hypothetical protein
MKTLKDLANYLNKRNISYKLVNEQIIMNRRNYDHNLISEMFKIKNQIDTFYLDSTMVFYINKNILTN